MTPKELQEQYLSELRPRIKEVKKSEVLPPHYIEHVRNQAATLTRLLNKEQGAHYINEALKDWPKQLEEELQRLKQS